MRNNLILSFVMALLWMIFAGQFTIEGFVVGYIFGFAILYILRANTSTEEGEVAIKVSRIPSQLFALMVYTFQLSKDVIVSGMDVAKKVLSPQMPINPGVHTISTQDKANHELVSALSAHSITITPGELVIDFDKDEQGQTLMIVHALDQEASNPEKLNRDQTNRLVLIRRILGLDAPKEE